MPSTNLGRVRPVFKGTWAAGTAYIAMDVVYHDGSSYYATAASTGEEPGTGASWAAITQGWADTEMQAIIDAEAARASAESGRVSGESGRVTAESGRVTAESARSVWEAYNASKAYAVGNKVQYNGSSYRCKLATTAGILPTNGTYWDVIAGAGGAIADASQLSYADQYGRYKENNVGGALDEIAGAGRTTETVKGNADAIATKVSLTGPETVAGVKTFSDSPIVPTAAVNDDSTKVANTAFINGQASSTAPLMDGVTAAGSSKKFSREDHVHPTDTSREPSIYQNAGARNSIYRGKYLGSSVTAAQYAEISAGTFADMYIGDYWTIGGVNYRIAAFNYFLRCGDTDFNTNHITLVPDAPLYNAQMNTSNITTGAYVGSAMRVSNLASAIATIGSAFSGHVKTHRQLLANATSGGKASGWAWYDASVEIMNEVMVYGCSAWGESLLNNGFQTGTSKTQLPLFALRPDMISNRNTFWLRDVADSVFFALVGGDGAATYYYASGSLGVRPAFSIS